MLLAVFFIVAFAYVYWDTQRKLVFALSAEDKPSKTAALSYLWERFKWAWPFIWDFFRLVVLPYAFERMVSKLFGL